jgi:rubrerythrin
MNNLRKLLGQAPIGLSDQKENMGESGDLESMITAAIEDEQKAPGEYEKIAEALDNKGMDKIGDEVREIIKQEQEHLLFFSKLKSELF